MTIYTIHDKLAEESGPVFEAKNDATAVRAFNHLIGTSGEEVNSREYSLLRLADIDHSTNVVTLCLPPVEVFVPEPHFGKIEE